MYFYESKDKHTQDSQKIGLWIKEGEHGLLFMSVGSCEK